ncbi:aminotransferase-like domain-containing protein [Streptomyces bobili]|uniref:aminotransferase-like domain-containing protein n=1 Tax=Streptomyces bobili TaxID=67280 RepID=UPI0037FF954A
MKAEILFTGLRDNSTGPLYQRLAESVREAVRRGEAGAGSKLPSERDLARALGVSRTTVVGAYRLLRDEGLLESERGSGTRIVASNRDIGPATPTATMPSGKLTDELAPGVLDLSGSVVAGLDGLPDLSVGAVDLGDLATDVAYRPLGLPELREQIAVRCTRLGLPTVPEEILITNGAQQAITLLCVLFGRNGGVIVTENPTYAGVIDAARSVGATVLALPTDAEGLEVGALREALNRSRVSLLYIMTTCQNPTGTTMSTRRRHQISRLAEQAGVPIVDDTTLADLVFHGSWHPLQIHGEAVVVGSLSKLFWPGLRVGWLRGPRELVLRLGRLKVVADLGSSYIAQRTALGLLPSAADVAEARRGQLCTRLDLLAGLLLTRVPAWSFTRPSGGPFLWVRLPCSDGEAFAQFAMQYGVRVLPGIRTSADRRFGNYLRLSFVAEPADIQSAVGKLADAWAAFESVGRSERISFDIVV